MQRLALVLLTALLGCGSSDGDRGGANAMADAATTVDATMPGDPPGVPPSTAARTPVSATGTTPAGSLDEARFMSVDYVGGHCPGTYYVRLYRTDAPEDQGFVMFIVSIPRNATQPPTGTIGASAWAGAAKTDDASFEIVQLDAPGPDDTQTLTVRIAGRLTINTPGWNVDLDVDATTPANVCLIL
ncbi:MAG: hypothetical protein HOV81_11515 [Kofleriaceae bacterium]|nr:hypothetical protein [Kofleriaceae bacterium]